MEELDKLNAHIGVVTNLGAMLGLLFVLLYKAAGFATTLSGLALVALVQPGGRQPLLLDRLAF